MKRLPLILLFVSLLASPFFYGCNNSEETTVSQIDSLISNEPKLSVKTSDDLITKTTTPHNDGENHGITVSENHKLTRQFEQMVAFDPNAASLYPGALIQGKGLPDGILIPVETDRTPLTITISDFYQKGNLSTSRVVKKPSLASINDAMHSILKQEANAALGADISFSMEQVYSMDQAFLSLNASYKWATGSISGALATTRDETYSKFLVRFVEKYFTVSCQPPQYPTSYIAKAGYDDLLHYLQKTPNDSTRNPLCYVSSVTYGRELWVLIESQEKAADVEASLNASFGGVGSGGGFSISDKTKNILNQSFVQSYLIGGALGKSTDYLGADKATSLSAFIKEKDTFNILANPPRPISYTAAYLSDNSPARVSATTDYTINTNYDTIVSQLVSASVQFNNGNDGKDKSTGLRVYLFDNKTINVDYAQGLNKPVPTITSQVAYADLINDEANGVQFKDNSTVEFPLTLKQPTNNLNLADGALFVWMFPHGHERWQFTPTLHLKFKNPRLNVDKQLGAVDFDQNSGIVTIPFTLR